MRESEILPSPTTRITSPLHQIRHSHTSGIFARSGVLMFLKMKVTVRVLLYLLMRMTSITLSGKFFLPLMHQRLIVTHCFDSSESGVVNIYETAALTTRNPKPRKSLMNFSVAVNVSKFNPDGQILALGCRSQRDRFKLVMYFL